MNTQKEAYKFQQKLNMILECITQAKALSCILLMTDFVKENF